MPTMLVLKTSLHRNEALFTCLAGKGWQVRSLVVPFPKLYRYLAIASTFRPSFRNWVEAARARCGKLHRTAFAFMQTTRFCEKEIARHASGLDVVFQFQGMFMPAVEPARLNVPYTVYTDYTMKLCEKYPPWLPYPSQRGGWYRLETALYRNAGRIFTFSERTRRSVVDDYGVEDHKVVAAGAGVAVPELPAGDRTYDGKTLLFVGIDFERKGGYVLLEAFEKVKREVRDAQLLIVGPVRGSLGITPPGVSLIGRVNDRARMESLYRQASVYVMPSISEPFGFVFLEAMSHKVPCIGTNIDAAPEIIEEGQTGFVVPPRNPDVLAQRIVRLLKDTALAREMGERGWRRVVSRFTWNHVADKIDSHLRALL